MTKNILQQPVLVLNRMWQPINDKQTVQGALSMMASDVATAMLIDGDDVRPVTWSEWITLPIRKQDGAIHSQRLTIRAPTVIIALNYGKVPKRRPSLSAKSIRERDNHTCQYTGRKLAPGEGNLDHVLPRSRGGKTSWSNVVLASRDVNSKKGALTPKEAGLKLLKTPKAPAEVPASMLIRNQHGIKDWELFLKN